MSVLLTLGLTAAMAQDAASGGDAPDLDAQLFKPSIDSETTLWTDDSAVSDDLGGSARILTGWANDPLVYVDETGATQELVGNLFVMDLLGALSYKGVRLGVHLPVVLRTLGDDPGESGLGDVGLQVKIRLLDRDVHPLGLGVAGGLSLPTSTTTAPLGSDGLGWTVQAIADKSVGPVLLAANLGTRGIPEASMENVIWDDQLFARLGASWAVTDAQGLSLDVGGNLIYGEMTNPAGRPAEALLGAWTRLGSDLVLRGGIGTGLTRGVGAPRVHAVVSLGWEPGDEGGDADLDGLVDAVDACPNRPEDLDRYQDSDGCPEATPVRVVAVDAEGIPLGHATVAVSGGGKQDTGAGIVETQLFGGSYEVVVEAPGFNTVNKVITVPDGEPYEARVTLMPAATDGLVTVRVKDAQGNPVPAVVTLGELAAKQTQGGVALGSLPAGRHTVSVEAEGYNPVGQRIDVKADDELVVVIVVEPIQAPRVEVKQDRIDIQDSIYFETGSAVIKAESFSLLDEIAAILLDHPELVRVRIEGHTDSRGSDSSNLRLSQDRAASVRTYLVDAGVAAKRLSSIGYGETKPLDPRETEEAWSENRRVDFWIEERRD